MSSSALLIEAHTLPISKKTIFLSNGKELMVPQQVRAEFMAVFHCDHVGF